MNRIALLVASLCLLTACSDAETENTKKTPKAQSGPTVFFVCDVTGDGVSYFSEMIEGPAGATENALAAAFLKKVESLDRTYYPLPPAVEANCESGTDPREMAMKALDARETAMQNGNAFRSVTGWKP